MVSKITIRNKGYTAIIVHNENMTSCMKNGKMGKNNVDIMCAIALCKEKKNKIIFSLDIFSLITYFYSVGMNSLACPQTNKK